MDGQYRLAGRPARARRGHGEWNARDPTPSTVRSTYVSTPAQLLLLKNGRVRRLLIESESTHSAARVDLRTFRGKASCAGTATGTRTGTARRYSDRFGRKLTPR